MDTAEGADHVVVVLKAQNHYERLKLDVPTVLSRNAVVEATAVKKAYRRVALLVHPDKSDSEQAAEAFRAVNDAFEALHDPLDQLEYLTTLFKGKTCKTSVQMTPEERSQVRTERRARAEAERREAMREVEEEIMATFEGNAAAWSKWQSSKAPKTSKSKKQRRQGRQMKPPPQKKEERPVVTPATAAQAPLPPRDMDRGKSWGGFSWDTAKRDSSPGLPRKRTNEDALKEFYGGLDNENEPPRKVNKANPSKLPRRYFAATAPILFKPARRSTPPPKKERDGPVAIPFVYPGTETHFPPEDPSVSQPPGELR